MTPYDIAFVNSVKHDKGVPRAVRARLVGVHLTGAPTGVELANNLFDLRSLPRGVGGIVTRAEALLFDALRALGHDAGVTAEDADLLAQRLRIGCWCVEGVTPDRALIVLGGMPWEHIFAHIAARTPPKTSGSWFKLALQGGPTAWSMYLDAQKESLRKPLEKVRRAAEAERLVGDVRTAMPWSNNHYFKMLEGEPVSFTGRAWGDFQIALLGEGHYLDWTD